MKKFISKNINQTLEIANNFSKTLIGGSVVTLNGDLGAGKTIFAKGVAKGLNVNEIVASPTFAIMNVYQGDKILYHYDMYRLQSSDEALELGLTEFIGSENSVCLIEWADIIEEYLPQNTIRVDINKINDDEREIVIYD